jgi:hypothetical protein
MINFQVFPRWRRWRPGGGDDQQRVGDRRMRRADATDQFRPDDHGCTRGNKCQQSQDA